jgi:hypothetical protein
MATPQLDIAENLYWDGRFSRPEWHLLRTWVESRVFEEQRYDAWSDLARQWLNKIVEAYDGFFAVEESDRFLLLAPLDFPLAAGLRFAEACADFLATILPGLANLPGPGKTPIVVLPDQRTYYHYVAWFFPEGKFGGSSGLCVQDVYPHVAMYGRSLAEIDATLAHELTHACLASAELPLWIEEGLTQVAEHDLSGRNLLEVTPEMGRRHKRHWSKHGLDTFWRGEGYSQPSRVQELSYQLSEILLRLLLSDHQPQWFGLVRTKQRKLLDFLRQAKRSDHGQAAAREHLGSGLESLAARFLGPGEWAPPAVQTSAATAAPSADHRHAHRPPWTFAEGAL